MKKIILTIDYELFLGKQTGSVYDTIIKPADNLLNILEKNNSKMTVFWDVLHYYALNKNIINNPELKEDISLIKNQIINFVKKGHDVQMHIHPHWLDAVYKNGIWKFNYDKFDIHSLDNYSEKEGSISINDCISLAKQIMENLILPIKPDYKVSAYRAGGYLIQPFQDLKSVFIEKGIYIDSSVCPNMAYNNGVFSYNFLNYPNGILYKFKDTPKIPDNTGVFIEIPVKTIVINPLINIYFKILRRIKYPNIENKRTGTGASTFSKSKNIIIKKFILLFISKTEQLTTDSSFNEKFNYILSKSEDFSTMILHPKLLNNHTLSLLKNKILTDKIKFVSIKDFMDNKINI